MAFPKKKYWIEAGDIKTKLPKQHDTGMFRSLDEIVWDILKCCGWDCCNQEELGGRLAELQFENGVTKTANTVKLGGALTEATLIEGDTPAETFTVYLHSGTDSTNAAHNYSSITTTVASATDTTVISHKDDKVTITNTGAGDAILGIGTASPTSVLHVMDLLEYANEAAAALGGILTTGAFYRTATGVVMVKL